MQVRHIQIQPERTEIEALDGSFETLYPDNITILSKKGRLWTIAAVLHLIDEGEED